MEINENVNSTHIVILEIEKISFQNMFRLVSWRITSIYCDNYDIRFPVVVVNKLITDITNPDLFLGVLDKILVFQS